MTEGVHEKQRAVRELPKAPTGIKGLDEITLGGLPKGRPTLVCGSAGCGKTLLGMEFLVRGAQWGEPGVCMTLRGCLYGSAMPLMRLAPSVCSWILLRPSSLASLIAVSCGPSYPGSL